MKERGKKIFRNKVHYSKLYRLTVRCSRCGQNRTIMCGDSEDFKRSSLVKIHNEGSCIKGKRDGHIDCLLGCTLCVNNSWTLSPI